jgi:hypothetical protein
MPDLLRHQYDNIVSIGDEAWSGNFVELERPSEAAKPKVVLPIT